MKILCIQLSPHVLPALGRGLSNSVGALILAQDRHCLVTKVFPSVTKVFALVTNVFPLVNDVFPSVTKVFPYLR